MNRNRSVFVEASHEFGVGDASFRAAGGIGGIACLVDEFYRVMDELPEATAIRRMHPEDLTEARDKLARFLCGWLGGPKRYAERYGSISIPGSHTHLAIGPDERDAWLLCMQRAAEAQSYPPAFGRYLIAQLRIPAQRVMETSAPQPSLPRRGPRV